MAVPACGAGVAAAVLAASASAPKPKAAEAEAELMASLDAIFDAGAAPAAGDARALFPEIPTDAKQAEKWADLYENTLSGGGVHAGFEHRTLARAVQVWRSWEAWAVQQAPSADVFRPSAVHLHGFLQQATSGGPTAAWGLYQALAWLRRHAGLQLPLDAAVVRPFARQRAGHQPRQQAPLRLHAFSVLVQYLTDPQATAWKKCGAALVARVLVSCLRWAHVERAVFVPDESTPRMQV